MKIQYIIISLIFVFFSVFATNIEAREKTVVKVGFFPVENMSVLGTETPSAYDVEYLAEIVKYTGWEYSYIPFRDWEEALDGLKAGEIDFLGLAQKSKQREDIMIYADYPAGLTYEAVFTRKEYPIVFEDFSVLNKKRFGCLSEYIRKKGFSHYADTNGFSPEIIEYQSLPKLRQALAQGEVDFILGNVEDQTEEQKVVGHFAPSPYYYVANLQKTELMDDFNLAQAEIRRRMPEFVSKLYKKHFSKNQKILLSKNELAYIAENPVVKIGLITGHAPISYYDMKTKKMNGIIVDLLDEIAAYAGFSFEYIAISDKSPGDFLLDRDGLLVAGLVRGDIGGSNLPIKTSETLLDSSISLVGRNGEFFNPNKPMKIAIWRYLKSYKTYIERNYPLADIVFTDDPVISGLDAVQDGRVDVMMQNSYVLARVLQGHAYEDLAIIPTVKVKEHVVIVGLNDVDPRLMSIVNKGISSIREEKREQSILQHTVNEGHALSIRMIYKAYKYQLFFAFFCIVGLIGGFIYIIRLKQNNLSVAQRSETVLRNIANNINGGVITLLADRNFTITYANEGFLDLIGYSKEEFATLRDAFGTSYIHIDDIEHVQNDFLGLETLPQHIELEFRIVRKDGKVIPSLFRGTVAENEYGISFYYCVVIDITDQKLMIEELQLDKERYQIITEQSDAVIFDIDHSAQRMVCSAKFEQWFGCKPPQHFMNFDNIHIEDYEVLADILLTIHKGAEFVKGNMRFGKADGTYLWCEVQVSVIRKEGEIVRYIGRIMDIDEEYRKIENLKKLSMTDPLTGLYNKKKMYELIESCNNRDPHALIFVDLDNFKAVNDCFGHAEGDVLLIEVANSIKRIFTDGAIIARFGGDEFCIFLEFNSRSELDNLANNLCKSLYKVYACEAQSVVVSASLGVAYYPDDADTREALLEKADQALYEAKKRGKNQTVFFEEIKNVKVGECNGK